MQLLGLQPVAVLLPGVVSAGGNTVPPKALTFTDLTPLQFSDGQYLETAA